MQFQTEIGCQLKPKRHLFLFPGGRHPLGQCFEHLLLETKLEEFLLVSVADDFDLIELPAAERFQDCLLVMFDEFHDYSASAFLWTAGQTSNRFSAN